MFIQNFIPGKVSKGAKHNSVWPFDGEAESIIVQIKLFHFLKDSHEYDTFPR